MANVVSAQFKKNLQTYQLLKGNATLTKSLVLRLVLGVLGGLPITSLALFTAFERLSYSIVDVWTSQKSKSKSSLFKVGVLGLFLKVLADITLVSLFLSSSSSTLLAPVFLSISGALLGIGQALTQGHIEDFYQIAAKKYLSYLTQNSQIQHQQKSFSYWSWWAGLNMLSIVLLLSGTYFLYYFYKVEVLLLITAAQNIFLIFKLVGDQKKYSASESLVADTPAAAATLSKTSFSVESVFLTIINSLSMLLLLSSCYFMFITICLDDSVKSQFNLWVVILMFILGYEYFGALLSQWLAPKLIKYYKQNMFLSAVGICLTSLIFIRFHSRNMDFFPSMVTYSLFLIYPLVMSFCLKIIGSMSLYQIQVGKRLKTKELAYSTFPGHLLLSAYCVYLVSEGIGIPDLITTLSFNLHLSFVILVLVTLYLFYQKTTNKVTQDETSTIQGPN